MSKIYVHLIDGNCQELRGMFPREKVAEAVGFFLAPEKKGKPDCEFCHGRGFVVYTAGGDTREDQCGCMEKPWQAPDAGA